MSAIDSCRPCRDALEMVSQMTEGGRELTLRMTVAETRVILAALNTVLSRPKLFRPSVLEMAEGIATRLVRTLQSIEPS